jgi:hypothetical protein
MARRLAREEHMPSASDLAALLELGLTQAEIASAIEGTGARLAGEALGRLGEVVARRGR